MIYAGFEIEIESNDIDSLESIYELMDETAYITGWNSKHGILEYHKSSPYISAGKWSVEEDSSMTNGAEFIMPPKEKNEALHILEKFLSHVEKSECYTLDSCGLHLNISAYNKTVAGMNNLYFLSNINQRLLYAFWKDRLKGTNSFCVPMKKIIEQTYPLSIIDTEFQHNLFDGRYKYVNKKITNESERLEIRVMGGKGYHKKIKEITITTNMFCDLLEKSYKKSQPKSKKRIISYINRIQKKDLEIYSLWKPPSGNGFNRKTFFYYHTRIKNTLENTNISVKAMNDSLYNRYYYYSPNIWECYCSALMRHLQLYDYSRYPDTVFIKKATKKINETYYYIFKYLDKTKQQIPDSMFANYLNGKSQITKDCVVLLTIPEDEKSTDIVWLYKYNKKLSRKAKTIFINSLSLSALRFVKKKNIISQPSFMYDIINHKIKKLTKEKQA